MKTKLSVIINTCNEAHHLKECIASIRDIADEIIITDMQSTDGSAELAESLGCVVLSVPRAPAPEPEARIAGIEAAHGDWVFIFDPDMRISKETQQRIRGIIENDQADVVDFYCMNYYFGFRCVYGHGSRPVFRKLFKKVFFDPSYGAMHTFWHDSVKGGRVLQLPREYALLHYGYETFEKLVISHTRYAKQEAFDDLKRGLKPSYARLVVSPVKKLFGNYLIRLGFLDGWVGFVVACAISWYAFQKECFLWELSRGSRNEG